MPGVHKRARRNPRNALLSVETGVTGHMTDDAPRSRSALPRMAVYGVAGVAGLALLAGALFQDALFRAAIHPSGAYRAAPAPQRPDYAQPASWAMRPANPPPGGWETPWGTDVFFITPTSAYSGDNWNAPIDDVKALKELTTYVLPNHAAPFNTAAPTYAPLYRQAPLHAELTLDKESASALDLAYSDVLRAFDHYMETDNRARGVIVAGSGQGGLHALRLLKDRFQEGALKDRLTAAYIIDAGVTKDMLATLVQPACETPDALHCVVAWSAADPGNVNDRRNKTPTWTSAGYAFTAGKPTVCINPLFWTSDEAIGVNGSHRGAVRATDAEPPQIKSQSVSARCDNGVLRIASVSPDSLRAHSGWGGKYKTPAFNLFYADIAFNAGNRARLMSDWLAQNAAKPAEPLPPIINLADAPIHRPDGKPDPVLPDPMAHLPDTP